MSAPAAIAASSASSVVRPQIFTISFIGQRFRTKVRASPTARPTSNPSSTRLLFLQPLVNKRRRGEIVDRGPHRLEQRDLPRTQRHGDAAAKGVAERLDEIGISENAIDVGVAEDAH